MSAASPVVALLTDFGLHDHYVGVMKAVILGVCPEATLIDLTHDIAPQDVLGGALALEAAVPFLPDGTVVVAVVDPGVGSGRLAVAVDTGRVRMVGPDNGVFTLALRQVESFTAVELTESRFHRVQVSRTFEGRDRFAPVAGWLARGVSMGALGPPVGGLVLLDVPAPDVDGQAVAGQVLRVDRFGNLITNIDRQCLAGVGAELEVRVGDLVIPTLSNTYADVPAGAWCALVGSTERLEISINGGHAAARLGLGRGAAVHVRGRVTT